jgi:hypothetical protein
MVPLVVIGSGFLYAAFDNSATAAAGISVTARDCGGWISVHNKFHGVIRQLGHHFLPVPSVPDHPVPGV